MRKLLLGGIALLTAVLLNAEDTKVSSYTGTIDSQMSKAAEPGYERQLRDSAPMMSDKERREQQEKWDRMTDSERREIQNKRMKEREEGIEHINKKLRNLDDDARKIQEKRADSDNKDKYDEKLQKIDRQRNRLQEMKARLERAPMGENVDLESAASVKEETDTNARHY